jgi:hypothetical protein
VPGTSPVTVAGAARDFSPASLSRTKSKIRERERRIRRARSERKGGLGPEVSSSVVRFPFPVSRFPAPFPMSWPDKIPPHGPRLHARLRSPAPRRVSRGRARRRQNRRADRGDLPPALPRARRPRYAPSPGGVGGGRHEPPARARRLRSPLEHAPAFRRQAHAARGRDRLRRHRRHHGHGGGRGGPPHARISRGLLQSRSRCRSRRPAAPSVAPRGDRTRGRRDRGGRDGGVALLRHRGARRPTCDRGADRPRVRRGVRRARLASIRRQFLRQWRGGGQH